MKLGGLWWFFMFPGVLMFQQNQYNVTFERIELVAANSDYLFEAKTHNFKFNRTQAAAVLTCHFKQAVGNELKMEVQAYKMASNEYREFPLRFMFDYCQFVARNEFGLGELYSCGNSTGCPFKKGFYTSCVWAPNGKNFPPNVPGGSYRLDIKLFFHSVEVVFLQGYATIKYPECKTCLF